MNKQMLDAINHYETTTVVFGELKQGALYSSAVYGALFGAAAVPIMAQSAAANSTVNAIQGLKTKFSVLDAKLKTEIALATSDAVSLAAGNISRQALLESTLIEIRRQSAQMIIQESTKRMTIEAYLRATSRSLVK